MEFEFLVDGVRRTIVLEQKGDVFTVRDGAFLLEADIRRISPCELLVRTGGHSEMVTIARDGERRFISAGGRSFAVTEPSRDAGRFAGGEEKSPEGIASIKAPMPGKVIKVNVTEGQEVRKNQSLVIVEAMKMENEIRAAAEGVVKRIFVSAGELVDSEKTLIELESKT
jgi:biotin carboxyl carrier protein